MPATILDDPREISGLVFDDDGTFTVGRGGVTRIEAYGEAGQGAYVPWFAVYCGEEISERVNAATVSVVRYLIGKKIGDEK